MIRTLLCLTALAIPALARDYVIKASAGDAFEAIRNAKLQPGDRILLTGGSTYKGTLRLDASARKVVITSSGKSRAVIDGGAAEAILLDGAQDIEIRNLTLRGAGRKTGNTSSGLLIRKASNVTVDSIDVSGFRSSGVHIDGSENVKLTKIHAFLNGFSGISSGGELSRNIYVGYSLTENNPGDPTIRKNHSGNGIVLGKVTKATIEYCESRYNGWEMPWTGNGPVGIWTYESDDVLIQYNVAHHNRSNGADGGGFDLDGGTRGAIVQYNYSHSNYGSGYLICQYDGATDFANNVVRYNISQDDGLRDHDAGIFVWVGGPHMKSTLVHNNTIWNNKGSAVAFGVSSTYKGPLPEMTFYNNIFVSEGPQIRGNARMAKFAGNLYWTMGVRGFRVDTYKSFDEWVAGSGQEKHNGKFAGLWADPLLRKDDIGLLTDPMKLSTLREYQVLPGSPAIDAGIDIQKVFGIDPGKRDYYGSALPADGSLDIGAHETAGAGRLQSSR